MNPIFTLPYPEFALANQLQRDFPRSQGFSIFVPASREEKGIDLILVHKRPKRKSKVITFQIKSSRTYSPRPRNHPRTEKLAYRTWFNTFEVQEAADFYLLFGIYFTERDGSKIAVKRELRDLTLVFTNLEMKKLLDDCRTHSGAVDKMFGFGFNDEEKVVQTRGNPLKPRQDYTRFLLRNRVEKIRRHFRMSSATE